jgi:hypothetical protein
VKREEMTDLGLEFTRRSFEDGRILYMIRNNGTSDFKGYVSFTAIGNSVLIHDPMTGEIGKANVRDNEVLLHLNIGETAMLTVGQDDNDAPLASYETTGEPVALNVNWNITFTSGGPVLPPQVVTDTLGSWTYYNGEAYGEFSGTAVYKATFSLPERDNGWVLDLGDVRESARVILNGKEIGRLITPPFRVKIEPSMAQQENALEIQVTNLMANRIISLDKKGVKWKKFYNINFPARKEENRKDGLFDASEWTYRPSGLLGPVQLLPIENSVNR